MLQNIGSEVRLAWHVFEIILPWKFLSRGPIRATVAAQDGGSVEVDPLPHDSSL